ncbi:hypothetical protein PgNI_10124 [Pyricularia grisea]|uniref:Zn(2)-C6 fungal-type domain-containing protein n=1 Tax=Pyricularia grisea TaxID=148305 RepID=A0A6P8AYE1_PYRGI|nr:hypothetical protein PgNI_10124 [Pyricularia grisea]TLD07357.1 hypothetical protein PgNI_10124 [Pyricularia grisea]
MVRKGNKKVRTGCKTCKIRKIKCDEEKPACRRCTDTGRTCDGYNKRTTPGLFHPTPIAPVGQARVPRGHGRILVLSRTANQQRSILPMLPSSIPGLENNQGRALQFFGSVVAPALSKGIKDEFWRRVVLQMASTQPAVRHALTAISTVFEVSVVRDPSHITPATPTIGQNPLATDEYNKAIRHMINCADDQLAVVVCIIFVSLEILQQNRLAAVDHCRHGVLIMNNTRMSPWVRDNILPTLRRLAVFPYFFGSVPDSFPALSEVFHPGERFRTLDDALASMDSWTAHAMRLIRGADPYRIPRGCDDDLPEDDYRDPYRSGPLSGNPIPEDMRAQQQMVLQSMRRWQDGMNEYLTLAAAAATPIDPEDLWKSSLLQMRCLVLQVWLTANFFPEEGQMAFDQHMDSFRKVVSLGYKMRASRQASAGRRQSKCTTEPPSHSSEAGNTAAPPIQFSFASEMGVMPILFFTTMRCRDLELRLHALALLWELSTAREGLFRVDRMAHTARRCVELEHDIDLARWRWRGGGDSVREFQHVTFGDNPAAWSHDPLQAVPETMRLWDALDPVLMRAVLRKGDNGLANEQDPARGRTVRFVRYRDGKLQRWEEKLSIEE